MTNANATPQPDVAAIAARVEEYDAIRAVIDTELKWLNEHDDELYSPEYTKHYDALNAATKAYEYEDAIDDIRALLAAHKRAEAENTRLREALKGVDELAAEGVGEFSLSSARRDFLDIRDVVSEVLHKRTATLPAKETHDDGN